MLFRLFFGTRFRSRLFESLKYGVHFSKNLAFADMQFRFRAFHFASFDLPVNFPNLLFRFTPQIRRLFCPLFSCRLY